MPGRDDFFGYGLIDAAAAVIVAGTDRDDDDVICDIEDACGFSPAPVTLSSSGEGVADVDFLLTFGVGQRPPPVDDDLP